MKHGEAFLNVVRREALMVARAAQIGPMPLTVTAYNPKTHTIRGILHPSEIETGWIPLGSPYASADAGVLAGPEIGDQFIVSFMDGDASTAIATHRLFSHEDPPPVVQSGEVIMRHKSGTQVFLDKDGQLTATHGPSGNTITMSQDKSITLTHHDTGSSFAIDKDGNHVHDAKGKAIIINAGSFALTGSATLNGQPIATKP